MDQDSLQSKEAANLATPTVLNVQEMSITAQNVSQDSQLIHDQENVSLKQNVLMVKNSTKELVLQSVTLDSISMKEFVYMEDVSMDMLPTPSEDVLDQWLHHHQDPTATSINTFKTDNVLVLARADTILTQPQRNVLLVLLTASLASVDHSVLSVIQDTI